MEQISYPMFTLLGFIIKFWRNAYAISTSCFTKLKLEHILAPVCPPVFTSFRHPPTRMRSRGELVYFNSTGKFTSSTTLKPLKIGI